MFNSHYNTIKDRNRLERAVSSLHCLQVMEVQHVSCYKHVPLARELQNRKDSLEAQIYERHLKGNDSFFTYIRVLFARNWELRCTQTEILATEIKQFA